MISHEHKVILIHIPRCAGSSIERFFCGKDWNGIDPTTKHTFASYAKKIYKDYWNDYFKFSFVRDPWTRTVSLSKYPNFYGVHCINGKINLEKYLKKNPGGIELDKRVNYDIDEMKKLSIKNSVYLNYINEELDYIGKTETFDDDWDNILKKINYTGDKKIKVAKYDKSSDDIKKNAIDLYDANTKKIVKDIYKKDFKQFGYI